jgi:hypothetical protein
VREILRHAEDRRTDLLVMGTHGRSGFEALFLGSVTEKVLRSTHVPVLTVPPAVERVGTVVYKTILCPIEFADPSTRALENALTLAEETSTRHSHDQVARSSLQIVQFGDEKCRAQTSAPLRVPEPIVRHRGEQLVEQLIDHRRPKDRCSGAPEPNGNRM